jgi:drug/metabolite transporter (DMT)-like permease
MSTRGTVLFALMCVIWGIPYLLIREAVLEMSPAMLVLIRTGGAAVLLLPLALARREVRPALRRLTPVLAFAAIEIAVPWVLLSSAEKRISSSLTGLLIAATPLVGAVIARTTGARERLGTTSLAGLLLGVGGVAALVGLDLGGVSGFGVAEVCVVAVCYAAGPAILSRYLSGVPALGVLAVSLTASALVYAPIAAFSLPDQTPSGKAIASAISLTVVCTVVAFLLFFALIAEVGPVRATVITYVNPAVAAALGVGLLDERFTTGMAVGFVLILTGSVLATRPRAVTRAASPPAPSPARAATRG